jgi:glutamate-1-semialdehyde 2,1-aminomutase
MALSFERSRELHALASASTPGGVHSNARLAEAPWPLFFVSGDAAHLVDADGNELIDFVLGQGALLLGHRPPAVIAAVLAQLERGILFAGQHDLEIEAARRIVGMVPGAEQVRFNVTGTEAIQAAIRIARAVTGRHRILRFQGHYDGWADPVLYNLGPRGEQSVDGAALTLTPGSLGIAPSSAEELSVIPWDDPDALDAILDAEGPAFAAVLMEPIMANTGVALPSAGYLEHVRARCTELGIPLIFDEVITGFRVHPGGAQGLLGVTPDLSVFGKALGSGFPVACVAGRADLLADVGTGRVVHAGTFNSHPVALAAAVATLDQLQDPETAPYERMEAFGRRLREGIQSIASSLDLELRTEGLSSIFAMTLGPAADAAARHESEARARLRILLGGLIARGVRVSTRGTWYLSAAHTHEDVERSIEALADAARDYREHHGT